MEEKAGQLFMSWSLSRAEAKPTGSNHDAMLACGADVVTAPLVPPGAPDQRLVGLVLARARSRSGWMTGDDGEHRAAHG